VTPLSATHKRRAFYQLLTHKRYEQRTDDMKIYTNDTKSFKHTNKRYVTMRDSFKRPKHKRYEQPTNDMKIDKRTDKRYVARHDVYQLLTHNRYEQPTNDTKIDKLSD
jgi:hypothetical protein